MKVAILTHPLRLNYGGLLQNYALQKVLISKGFEVETLSLPAYKNKKKIFKEIRNILFTIRHLLLRDLPLNRLYWPFNTQQKATQVVVEAMKHTFTDEYIQYSRELYDREDLEKYIKGRGFDTFIVGSDQVWRSAYVSDIGLYFLDFLDKDLEVKRISYAASFGISEWTFDIKETCILQELAHRFNAISVREKSGVSLCDKYLGIRAELVCDPTMLLTGEDYKKIIRESPFTYSMKGRVLAYILDKNSYKQNLITKISQDLRANYEIYSAELDLKPYGTIKDALDKKPPTVAQWLRAICECEFLITDSFHGTVFAILFHKPFIVFSNRLRGNSRIESLLSTFKLQLRLINEELDYNAALSSLIDWQTVDTIHAEIRKKGLNFLLDSLK